MEQREGLLVLGMRGIAEGDILSPAISANYTSLALVERLLIAMNKADLNTVLPSDIQEGNLTGHDVLLTFQPGYANNLKALPLLKKYGAKALFLVAPFYIQEGLAFPCDFMQRLKPSERDSILSQKSLQKREKKLKRAMQIPQCEREKPMSIEQLEGLSAERNIAIGIMPFLGLPGIKDSLELFDEINHAGDFVAAVTGRFPEALAFPDGQVSQQMLDLLPLNDIHIGLTENSGFNTDDELKDPKHLLKLKRRFLPTISTKEPENLENYILANRFFAGDYPFIG